MAYTSGTKTLSQEHLGFREFNTANLAQDKFNLLLNPRNLKLKGSGGEMSQDGEVRPYEPFGGDKDETPGKEALAKLGGGLVEACGYLQGLLVDNAYKLLENTCLNGPNTEEAVGDETDTPRDEPGAEGGNVLPLKVRYEEAGDTAHIKIPLGQVAAAKNLNYRTVLKSRDKKLMELSINNFNQEFPSFRVMVPTKRN